MASALAELASRDERDPERRGIDIVTGTVMTNSSYLPRASSRSACPPWARSSPPGLRPGRGLRPRLADALPAQRRGPRRDRGRQPGDAYVLGGLWGTLDRPPNSNPAELGHKTTFKTGVVPGIGHVLEFDDVQQRLDITSSTGQKITMAPDALTLETTGGTL